ncbi:membrane fusion protein, multidrug efflux system [Arboricoccus pini]|uniref:Membrane fusion protein, multidrug efflux system n=1 Tax=Arboricoccus pini TaxID=1963835 RepID=A0A212RD01_9PROT|nr:efflux RND transporter periplasmic adaptor subunit [Arboricoccus pini]SNB70118.1 membrane fusion protein, multidrug efflux system [Arboricoccus pini]
MARGLVARAESPFAFMSMRKPVFFVLSFLFVAGGAYALKGPLASFVAPSPAAEPQVVAVVPVSVAVVQQKAMPDLVQAVGTVRSIASIEILSRLNSQVTMVAVQDGAMVKEGDLLFQLDKADLDAQVQRSQADIDKDQSTLAYNQAQLRRYTELASKHWQSQDQLDQVRAAVASGQATLEADAATLRQLQVQRSWARITAPVAGRVGIVEAHLGTTVKANDPTKPLVTINQISPIYVSFAVPERYLPRILAAHAPQAVEVKADGAQGAVDGKVAVVDNTVDQSTGTITLQAIFDNKDEALWPGQSVRVRLTLSTDPQALVVPAEAVQVGQDGAYVFVVPGSDKPQRAEARKVDLARTVDGMAVLSSGVRQGEFVIIEGQLRLDDGTPVRVMKGGNAQAAL